MDLVLDTLLHPGGMARSAHHPFEPRRRDRRPDLGGRLYPQRRARDVLPLPALRGTVLFDARDADDVESARGQVHAMRAAAQDRAHHLSESGVGRRVKRTHAILGMAVALALAALIVIVHLGLLR